MFVLGLAGQAAAGKDTVADYLVKAYGFVKFAFSDAIYAEVQAAYGLLDQSLLRDRATKEVATPRLSLQHCQDPGFIDIALNVLDEDYARVHPRGLGHIGPRTQALPLSPREVLQWWGTEYRRAQNPHYWINQNEDWLRKVRADHLYPEHAPQYFVNPTVRSENEREWIHTGAYASLWQGNVWHIRRQGIEPVAGHVSETVLAALPPERELWNNDTIERLYRGVDLLMSTHARFVRVEPMAPYAPVFEEKA